MFHFEFNVRRRCARKMYSAARHIVTLGDVLFASTCAKSNVSNIGVTSSHLTRIYVVGEKRLILSTRFPIDVRCAIERFDVLPTTYASSGCSCDARDGRCCKNYFIMTSPIFTIAMHELSAGRAEKCYVNEARKTKTLFLSDMRVINLDVHIKYKAFRNIH